MSLILLQMLNREIIHFILTLQFGIEEIIWFILHIAISRLMRRSLQVQLKSLNFTYQFLSSQQVVVNQSQDRFRVRPLVLWLLLRTIHMLYNTPSSTKENKLIE